MKRLLSIIIMLSMVVCSLPLHGIAADTIAVCNIADGAENVTNPNLTEQVTVTFIPDMDKSTLTYSNVKLYFKGVAGGGSSFVPNCTVGEDGKSVSYNIKDLRPNTQYSIILSKALKKADSSSLLSENTTLVTFTTGNIFVEENSENTILTNVSQNKTVSSSNSLNGGSLRELTDGSYGTPVMIEGDEYDGNGTRRFTIDLNGAYVPKAVDICIYGAYSATTFRGITVYGHNELGESAEMTRLGGTESSEAYWPSDVEGRIFLDNDKEYKYITISKNAKFRIYEATVWAGVTEETDDPDTPGGGNNDNPGGDNGDDNGGETPSPTVEKITLNVSEASEINSKSAVSSGTNGKYIYIESSEYVIWDAEITEEGKYLISFFAGFRNSKEDANAIVYVDKDDELGFVPMPEQTILEVVSSSDMYDNNKHTDNPAGVVELTPGTIRVKVYVSYYNMFLSNLQISRYDDFVLSGVKAGETKIDNGDTIERSTDCFELTFNRNLDGNTASRVKLVNKDTDAVIKAHAETENNILRLYLNETLDYDAEYSLVLDGISDVYGVYQINDTFASYKTSSEDGDVFSSMGISDEKISIDYNKTEITGIVLSSQGMAIGGRKVDAYLKDTKGTVSTEPVATCISGDGGAFNLNYTIPEESDSGLYTFILKAEYADSQTEVSVLYVSKTINEEITNALKLTKDFNEVADVIDTYKLILDINPSKDLKGIADTDSFYNHFVGKTYGSFDDFLTDYYNMIVFETVNQTTDTKVVDGVLKDEVSCERLGADKFSADRIINGRESFLKALVDLKAYTEHSDYMIEFNKLLNEYLSKEFNKEKPVISAESVSVYSGQGIPVKLAFANDITDVSEFEFRIRSLDGAQLILNPSVVLDIKGQYTVKVEGDTLIITVSAGTILPKAKDIATLYLASPDNTGAYDFTVSASVTHRVADKADDGSKIWYEADNKAEDKNITATVTASSQGSQGSGSSVIPSGGKKPSSSGSVGGFTPVVTPTPQDTKYSFADLPAGHWAEESINALVEKGVISKPENRIYNPDKLISREEFIKLVVVAFDMWNKDIQGDSFSDVTIDNWYYSYVYSAKDSGIITGDGNGAFGAGSAITREDMAVIIKRVMELKNIAATEGNAETFSDDGEIAEYAKQAVYAMKNAGIINGVGGNAFEPKTGATRAMAAKVIYYLTKIIAN